MTTTNPDNKWCCTCQSWHGVRRIDSRTGRFFYDNSSAKVVSPCNMGYKKPGACPAANCRGYVRWVEL